LTIVDRTIAVTDPHAAIDALQSARARAEKIGVRIFDIL